ncbi:hypothetical protein ACFOZY_03260 [Chungangia koreensis]|uniref:Uncharacterized protein n=1 Tax=Chungangia koreensis TaxID=752657 RepID=A0ABV8X491_9LACT
MGNQLDRTDIRLVRALSQVIYDRSFLFDDLKQINYISKGLKGFFGQIQKDEQNGSLILLQPDGSSVAIVNAESTSLDMQDPILFDFENLSKLVMDQVSSNLDVEEYIRMGTRLFFGKIVDSIAEGQELLSEKFFKRFQGSFQKAINNPTLAFTLQQGDDYYINVNLRTEMNGQISISSTGAEHKQDAYILIDIDVFTNRSESYGSFVEKSNKIAVETLDQMLGLLEG